MQLEGAAWSPVAQAVFVVDVLECPRCAGSMRVLSFIDDERTARRRISR